MPDQDQALRNLILQHVPEDGSSIGNKALLARLVQSTGADVVEEDNRRVRDALIAEGLLATGRGRGGSVLRQDEHGWSDLVAPMCYFDAMKTPSFFVERVEQ